MTVKQRTDRRQGPIAPADMLRLLVDRVSDYAIFALDPTGHVASWNAGAERIKGYKASDWNIGDAKSVIFTARIRVIETSSAEKVDVVRTDIRLEDPQTGELFVARGAGHNDVAEVGGEAYWSWLRRALGAARAHSATPAAAAKTRSAP